MRIQTRIHSTRAAESLVAANADARAIGSGFFRDLLERLFPILLDCLDPDDGEEVKAVVARRRDWSRRRIARGARQSARQDGSRLSRGQSLAVADELIGRIETSDETEITLVIREHDSTPA